MKTKVKKKTVRAVKTVDLTVRDFKRRLGLGTETKGYIAATVMLKMLCNRGIASEVAQLQINKLGRPSVIYRLPVEFTLTAKGQGTDAA